MREDRICAKYRLYQRVQSLQSSREKKPKAGGKREKKHITFTGKLEVCRFDSRVCGLSFVDNAGTSNPISSSQTEQDRFGLNCCFVLLGSWGTML